MPQRHACMYAPRRAGKGASKLTSMSQGLQLRLLQELCQTSVLERAPYGEPVKSRSHLLPAQEKPKKRASRGSLLWVHVV